MQETVDTFMQLMGKGYPDDAIEIKLLPKFPTSKLKKTIEANLKGLPSEFVVAASSRLDTPPSGMKCSNCDARMEPDWSDCSCEDDDEDYVKEVTWDADGCHFEIGTRVVAANVLKRTPQ